MSSPYKLTIELVPRPLWFINLRKEMQRSAWDRLRKQVYKDYSYHCGICSIGDEQLDCHERWHYNDEQHIQSLEGFIALCKWCHHCKHIGYAGILANRGELDMQQLISHFLHVDMCSRQDYEQEHSRAFQQWNQRNICDWTCDLNEYASLLPTNSRFVNGKFHSAAMHKK